MLSVHINHIISFIVITVQISGIMAALNAIMKARTAQGAIAWAVSLILLPYISLPLYLVFGGRKFTSYVRLRNIVKDKINPLYSKFKRDIPSKYILKESEYRDVKVIERLAKMPFTSKNSVELLINGEETFQRIFEEIEKARNYILVQFYIIRNDRIGNKLKELLIKKSQEGIDTYLIYDAIGSYNLSKEYIEELKKNNVHTGCFDTAKGFKNRLRLNFRNHRKVVVVDGKTAFVGGHNVGDEYLGKSKKFGFWRDTHISISGPAVLQAQLSFVEDWYWIEHKIINLDWSIKESDENKNVLILPSGPSDKYETCSLFFMNAIASSKKRIWIVSPYFVPDSDIIFTLHLAALRGVDVRIMLPEKADYLLVYLSSFSYINELAKSNIKFFRYKKGFLHQKVMLVDDDISSIGTANFDSRSFRINFEISAIVIDKDFAKEVEKMLIDDFENCTETAPDEYDKKPLWFKISVSIARLFSPIE